MNRAFLPLAPLFLAAAVLAQDDVEALIGKLGAGDYAVREEASKRLVEMGEKAVPALEKALQSEDLEVRLRAGRALRAIRGERSGEAAEPEAARPGAQMRSFRLSIQPDKVTAALTEMVDGKEVTREYEAKSLEELREKYPELRAHLGDGNRFRFRFGFRDDFDMDKFWENWNRSFENFDEDIRKWQEETRREFESMRRWLEQMRDRPRRALPDRGMSLAGPLLGVRASTPTPVLDAQLDLRGQGLVIEAVEKDSLAERLGIERYDVLLELNGRAIGRVEDVPAALRDRREGEKASAKVVRRAQRLTLTEAGIAAPK